MKNESLQFSFSSKLERSGPLYEVSVPARISKAIGKKGPVPVVAKICGVVELLVSLVPAGGGRHVLRLNTKTRNAAKIDEGHVVKVQVTVQTSPIELSIPSDLVGELRIEGVLEPFKSLPVGKQNHIIQWIDEAAHQKTRERRIQMAVEVAHRRREKSVDKRRSE